METNARLILDSVNPVGNRLTTFEVTLPKFLVAQFNTHRQLSRNSASSRAIPNAKFINAVVETPHVPIFRQNQRGMQSGAELSERAQKQAIEIWLNARNYAVEAARELAAFGVSKEDVNRLLEPFMFTTILASATEWDNFLYLRTDSHAQPEIQKAALIMQDLLANSEPQRLKTGEWHLPYVTQAVYDESLSYSHRQQRLVEYSVAQCARVSYTTQGDELTFAKAREMYERLSMNGHWSPFEHVARAMNRRVWSGNFLGWAQHRKDFENECYSYAK